MKGNLGSTIVMFLILYDANLREFYRGVKSLPH